MYIKGRLLDVDFYEELMEFEWNRGKKKDNRFIACSPFRDEEHPSFGCSLEHGGWIDSGGEGEYYKGDFVKLLSLLRKEEREETEEYLVAKYADVFIEANLMEWDWKPEEKFVPFLPAMILDEYRKLHPYLKGRGISERYQRGFDIGYDEEKRAIVIPWFDKDKRLVNIKFRSIDKKDFWYYKGGLPIKDHLFGLWIVRKKKEERVVLVESEIDCMYLWEHGLPAIAVGGSALTEKQEVLLRESGIKELILATDRDKAGDKLKRSIVKRLNGFITMYDVDFPYNDVNDIPAHEIVKYMQETSLIFPTLK